MMQRRQLIQLGLGLGWGISATAREHMVWQERSLVGFGTTLWIKAAHTDAGRLQQALDASVQAIRSVEKQMSLFDPDSAVNRLNRFGKLQNPDAELVSVLSLAQYVSSRSAGAFDVTMQPLWGLWSLHSQTQTVPSAKALSQTRFLVNWRALTGIARACSLERQRHGCIVEWHCPRLCGRQGEGGAAVAWGAKCAN